MSSPLKVLILEDRLADAGLMLSELGRAGFSPEWYVAGTESAYIELLKRNPDLILSDYSLQQTDALRALQILRDSGKRIPFIVVTDAVGDEAAVECLKRGAADFLLKDRIAMLGSAVASALRSDATTGEDYSTKGNETPVQSYLKSLPDYLYLVSESGEYLDLKSESGAVNGAEKARTVQALLPVDVAESFVGRVRSALESGNAQSMEFRIELYGEPKDYEARFFSTGGDLALVIVRDVGEMKSGRRAPEENNGRIDEAAKLQGSQSETIQQQRLAAQEFLSSEIAHILNNALAPILGFAELALTRSNVLEDKERVRNYLQHIKSSAQRTANVVSQLREFYMRSSTAEDQEAINLNDVVLEAMSQTKARRWVDDAESRAAMYDFKTNFQDLPPVTGSGVDLGRAVTALIDNALDAMPKGGTINLRTRQEGDMIVLEVSDSGAGMPEKVRQRCFEPFFTTMSDRGASGMGLAIAYGIIQRHKGTIQVESEEGQGTAVTVSLPVTQPNAGKADDEDEEGLDSRPG